VITVTCTIFYNVKLKADYYISVFLLFFSATCCAQCGTQRWSVKTLQDSEVDQINFTPKSSTVKKQLAFPKPDYHDDNPRDSTEKQVYKIKCKLVQYSLEDDSDWHLIVQDLSTSQQMVMEIPSTSCIGLSNSHLSKIQLSKKRLIAHVGPVKKTPRVPPAGTRLQIIGVGFFDEKDHPVGFSGREIHPVLELKVLQ
jgi:hypothetical protein